MYRVWYVRPDWTWYTEWHPRVETVRIWVLNQILRDKNTSNHEWKEAFTEKVRTQISLDKLMEYDKLLRERRQKAMPASSKDMPTSSKEMPASTEDMPASSKDMMPASEMPASTKEEMPTEELRAKAAEARRGLDKVCRLLREKHKRLAATAQPGYDSAAFQDNEVEPPPRKRGKLSKDSERLAATTQPGYERAAFQDNEVELPPRKRPKLSKDYACR